MADHKHVVVVANGELGSVERILPVLDAADLIIAADGGANALETLGRYPAVLVGDMDSIHPRVLEALQNRGCRILRYPSAKDETDTELALLEAVSAGAGRITLLGALGGRIDHALANLFLITLPEFAGSPVTLFDGTSYITLVRGHSVVTGRPGDTLSLIPVGGDAVVRTDGLAYSLRGEKLRFGPARGVSNLLLADRAHIWLSGGLMLAVYTPQEYIDGQ